jgi:hypothetical protein
MTGSGLLSVQCVVFIVLNILDGWSTWLVLKPDHYERERNPVARWVFRTLKLPAAVILFKAVLLSWLGVFIAYYWKEALTINIALLTGNLLFVYVVWHNFKVHRKYEQHSRFLTRIKHVKVITQ